MITYILFAIGFVILVKGADFLVEGACSIAKKLRVSDLVIGLTVVAFGTSFPELTVSVFASISGNAEIAVGNILGSNTFNILFILGVASLIYPLKVNENTVWKEIPLTLLAAVLAGVMANDRLIDGAERSALTRIDGLVLISFFIIFLAYILSIAAKGRDNDENAAESMTPPKHSFGKSVLLVVAGLAALIVGAKWTVAGAVKLATSLGVSQSLIGLTIVAGGTSLPELATSAVAAWKKNTDMAVGNIVGSNIFNIFLILGTSSIIRPLPVATQSNTDFLVTILASLLLFICMFTGKKRCIDRWEGVVFILLYIGYVRFLIWRG